MNRKAFLLILDGWGHGKDDKVSAIAQAHTPYIDKLYDTYPHAELVTYGSEVGLPDGQMGNSEVGHLNIGAGRIVYQDFARINKAIADDTLRTNPVVVTAIEKAKSSKNELHLLGLLSDGGVHSHIDHLIHLSKYFSEAGVQVIVHAFLDGRDTGPKSGKDYVKQFLAATANTKVRLASIVGRYYAMDRDNRWERTVKAYDLLVKGKGDRQEDPLVAIQQYYDKDITDEFMEPIVIGEVATIQTGSVVMFANFRTDRPRQITTALTQKPLDHNMTPLDVHFVTMTEYDQSFTGLDVIFRKDNIKDTLGEVVSKAGLTQLRIAETEKYPHVTFFLSGGREQVFEGEERIVVASPKVATYDLQPEMSAYEVTNRLHNHIEAKHPDLIVLNYANADMVGHTGLMSAAVQSAETLDACLEAIVPVALRNGYSIVIIADHGNSDIMVTDEGTPHTAHTLNQVPILLLDKDGKYSSLKDGKLADIAPTILFLMGLESPNNMTGNVLVSH